MPPSDATRLTYADFLRIPYDGKRHEIIGGVHYVTPSPNVRHQQLVGRLHYAIEDHLRRHPDTGQVFVAPLDVVLSNWDIVEPDLLLVLADQNDILTEQNVQGPPAVVIEVLSPGTKRRDRTIKRVLFGRTAVHEYWMVDPRDQSVTVFRRIDGRFAHPAALRSDEASSLTTALLPGFSLPLKELFR